ncbi:CinA family protein [Fibrobacter sp. UWEL]|uniref:CinA family protein n=1 Tax=Fibrobacter sp. UWEL TaxID=1896209 RepID=UPI0009129483|nr:CinA family protein [Fibrobacter sp. UWEL]SHK67476.1 nicotinamide-nucleotide amidase [Fibrobacter sp. UWEL]
MNFETINDLALAVKEALENKGEMMATAESCTGGLIASSIVDIPGSSAVLAGGIVAYQNEIKVKLLDVSASTIEKYGVVSAETVKEMAEGARKKFGCEWAVATTGIAGPGGAEPGKPVGTVWIGVASSLQNEAFCKNFSGNRKNVREKSVYIALQLLLERINQKSTCTKVH